MKKDDEGWYYLIWSSIDGKSNKWTVFGRMAFIGAIVSAAVGFGVAWLACDIWEGFVYILSGIQILVGIIFMILSKFL